jgi:hypothetical protein
MLLWVKQTKDVSYYYYYYHFLRGSLDGVPWDGTLWSQHQHLGRVHRR